MNINNNIIVSFIHYTLPWLLLTLYITASITSRKHKKKQNISLLLQTISTFLILLTFIGDSILFLIYILIKQDWWVAQSTVVLRKPTLDTEETSPLFEQNQTYEDDELSDIKTKYTLNEKSWNKWWEYIKKFTLFFPYIWPTNVLSLKIIIFFCFALLLISRYVNILTPQQLGIITDKLVTNTDNKGNMGLVSSIRSHLWIPINQHAYRNLSVKAFEHIHALSLDFHLSKKTGEIMSALDHGSSINTFFDLIIFQVLPVIIDIFIAIIYFFVNFDAYFALIIMIMTISYIYITIKITEWRTEYRRDMISKHREEYSIKCDSITNYETVKYFNAEYFEFNRHENAVKTYQKAEYNVLSSLNFLNTIQNTIYTIGLLSIAFLSAYKVIKNQTSVGNFVSLLTYMTQLQGPLNYFGRSLQSSFVDAERMLELFNEKPSVSDKPDAIDLKITHGEVIFDNVHFSYDNKKTALKALSFHAKAGTSVALVGESGSGKTTVLRCLFKFFNIHSGTIKIDGQNIHDVKLNSLRKNIGIVPQDTVLFNDTIMFNIRYAKPDASDEEVFEAARMAQIHDKIMTWPDKYDTKVGERGLRLSGGEKQRIAIARTILKNPKIILLDEATSALDTHTERQVQVALKKLTEGRTTICIAHRLSTIISCDLILCMKDGSIVESGTHEELLDQTKKLSKNCLYYSMWQKQIHGDKNSEENDKRDK
ncbi:unnamed protein product [Pneumocystis jirovecii]|uniref:P-loop containing nucleoside triphosphate hydrolase protein n=1 Tax=Pneumocystis jirovecii TaxID=42068 RepID=L0P9A8_PNEJI|nr:unnamed protein product [Pneumocystis jirovecii]